MDSAEMTYRPGHGAATSGGLPDCQKRQARNATMPADAAPTKQSVLVFVMQGLTHLCCTHPCRLSGSQCMHGDTQDLGF